MNHESECIHRIAISEWIITTISSAQGGAFRIRRCRESAGCSQAIYSTGTAANRGRDQFPDGIRCRRNSVARRHRQSHHCSADAANALCCREHAGAGTINKVARRDKPVSGSRRRVDPSRNDDRCPHRSAAALASKERQRVGGQGKNCEANERTPRRSKEKACLV